MKKPATLISVGLALVALGFCFDRMGVQHWPSNFIAWYNGPPSGASRLALGINESLEDASSWRIAEKGEKDRSYSSYEAITNGKIIFTGVSQQRDRTYWSHVHSVLTVNGENLSESLSASEKIYLFDKAMRLYNKLQYEKAEETFKVLHEKEQ